MLVRLDFTAGSFFIAPVSDTAFWHLMWNQLTTFFLGDWIIVFLALSLGWFASWKWIKNPWPTYEFLREPARLVILVPLVLVIATFGERNTRLAIHKQVAAEAYAKVGRAFVSTETELRTWAPDLRTNDQLVILSQGIGKIVGRTFDWVQNTYPEFELRTLSVFLYLGDDCDDREREGCIEDVIQEGQLEKDRRYFLRASLVGATITEGKRQYCPDLSVTHGYPDCKNFQPPPPGLHLEFTSVLCYPITLGTRRGGEKPFAAVCLDSTRRHAFDSTEDATWEGIRDQIACLATLLYEFHQLRDGNGAKRSGRVRSALGSGKSDFAVSNTFSGGFPDEFMNLQS